MARQLASGRALDTTRALESGRSLASLRMPVSQPTDISGCTLWLPPTGLSNDGSVWWNSSSLGASANFTATGTARPTYTASAINGMPGYLFDGTSDYLTGPTSSVIMSAAATVIFITFKIVTITLDQAVVYANDSIFSDGGADYGASLRATSNVLRSYNYAGSYHEPTALSISIGSTYVLTWRHTSSVISHQINRGTPQTTASGNTSGLGSYAFQLCACQAIRWASLYVSEVVMYNTNISTSDETSVREAMLQRAGI